MEEKKIVKMINTYNVIETKQKKMKFLSEINKRKIESSLLYVLEKTKINYHINNSACQLKILFQRIVHNNYNNKCQQN